jgi:hypothetical protein
VREFVSKMFCESVNFPRSEKLPANNLPTKSSPSEEISGKEFSGNQFRDSVDTSI